jgi:hypothetical protein
MDINFHYYAVKAVAIRAGFSEPEAQIIASYSQFVDDFDESGYVILDNVPIWARHLSIQKPDGSYWFRQVTTGFNSWFDMAALALESNQKWIVTPFHFFPKAPLNTLPNRADLRVVPARMDADSLLRDMLVAARAGFLAGGAGERSVYLLRIGVLLHIFADTYAHQRFSGFRGWENHSYLTNVTDNISNTDVTSSYSPNMYWAMPSIGHTNVGHAPDDSNIRFTMKQKSDNSYNYSLTYARSNTAEYCKAAGEILNYLLSCLGQPAIGDAEWEHFQVSLADGFLTTAKDVPTLNAHWHTLFPEIAFNYDKAPMLLSPHGSRQLSGEAKAAVEAHGIEPRVFAVRSDMWFHYNVFANSIRIYANGEPYSDPLHEALAAEAAAKSIFPIEAAESGESLEKSENNNESEVQ